MKLTIKPGVVMKLTNMAWLALFAAVQLAISMKATSFRVTSGKRERKRGKKWSFHFCSPFSQAFDFVVEGINANIFKIKLIKLLGTEYDVVYHDAGTGFHFHVENDKQI